MSMDQTRGKGVKQYMPRYPMVGLAGWSGSGKTTLLEKILPLLSLMGLRVNVVKSSHHDVELEPQGKDSARIRRAGAAEVMLASPYRYMLAHELRDEREPTLRELVLRMKPADLVLVEGFRDEPIPRIEVFRPSLGKKPMYPENDCIEVVASDAPKPDDLIRPVLWLDLNRENQVADWLLNRVAT